MDLVSFRISCDKMGTLVDPGEAYLHRRDSFHSGMIVTDPNEVNARRHLLRRQRRSGAVELDACGVRDAAIVTVICDRGDRYLAAGVFPAQ